MKYVAFLDILGFKEKLKKMDQNEAKQFIGDFSTTVYKTWNDIDPLHNNGYSVSDSLIIHSFSTGDAALRELVKIIDAICKAEFSAHSILIRGAIAKGEFDRLEARELNTLGKKLIVGQAYVDAYLLEGSVKTTGIVLSEDVYQDLLNAGEYEKDIVEESANGSKCYVLRYLTLDYLLDIERMRQFVEQACASGWLPHYYNSLYFALKNETNDKKVNQVFANLLNAVSKGRPTENWRDLDAFIQNTFDKNVFSKYQTRFLKFIRRKLFSIEGQVSNDSE